MQTMNASETACCDGCATEVPHADLDGTNRCVACRQKETTEALKLVIDAIEGASPNDLVGDLVLLLRSDPRYRMAVIRSTF